MQIKNHFSNQSNCILIVFNLIKINLIIIYVIISISNVMVCAWPDKRIAIVKIRLQECEGDKDKENSKEFLRIRKNLIQFEGIYKNSIYKNSILLE